MLSQFGNLKLSIVACALGGVSLFTATALCREPKALYPCIELAGAIDVKDLQLQYASAYEAVKIDVIAKMKINFPNVSDIRFDVIRESKIDGGGHAIIAGISIFSGRWKELGDARMEVSYVAGAMTFGVDIPENARGLGLNTLFALSVLKRFPNTKSMGGSIWGINMANFVVSLALEVDVANGNALVEKWLDNKIYQRQVNATFSDELKMVKSRANVKKLRDRIISAFSQTPAGKIRWGLGFQNIEKIQINLAYDDVDVTDPIENIMITFNVGKGIGTSDNTQIFIEDIVEGKRQVRELMPDGGMTVTKI